MKILAAIVAALALTGAAQAGNLPHPTLDAVATEVAGKPVSVWCETSVPGWVAFGADVDGFTRLSAPVVYLSPSVCLTLWAMLGRFDVGSYFASGSLLTLVHEAVHQRGIEDEGATDCTALPFVPDVAQRYFGVSATALEPREVRTARWVRVSRTKRVRVVSVRVVWREVPNPLLRRLEADALRWHRLKPPEYQGTCG